MKLHKLTDIANRTSISEQKTFKMAQAIFEVLEGMNILLSALYLRLLKLLMIISDIFKVQDHFICVKLIKRH